MMTLRVAFCSRTYYEYPFKRPFELEAMSRPAERTRGAIIKAAVHLFAEKGFQSASVRDIIVKARVNQLSFQRQGRVVSRDPQNCGRKADGTCGI
jgi:hypothetical protein